MVTTFCFLGPGAFLKQSCTIQKITARYKNIYWWKNYEHKNMASILIDLFCEEMVLQELHHPKGLQLFLSENLGHFGIREEEHFVLWILEFLLLDVGPKALYD